MNKIWHTNKTQPNATNEFEILIIWKNGNVSVDMPNLDEWNKLYLVEEGGYWKDIKENILYWQYIEKLFKNELELIRRNYGHK